MATRKDPAGQAEVQSKFDEAREKGYFGTTPETTDNKEFSLQSGPDSPSAAEQSVAALDQRAADAKASTKGGSD